MAQDDTEIMLARQLAGSLAMPIFIVDPEGTLLFYNAPAENILGRHFQETGAMEASIWSRLFIPEDDNGVPLLPESLPLMIALTDRHPAHSRFWIKGIDNVRRNIEVTAFPLVGKGGKFVGAMAIFWEVTDV